MKIVADFFNKVAIDLDNHFFPNVKYYRDNNDCADVHYTIELFNNGCLTYSDFINRLVKSCKSNSNNIKNIVDKYIIFDIN